MSRYENFANEFEQNFIKYHTDEIVMAIHTSDTPDPITTVFGELVIGGYDDHNHVYPVLFKNEIVFSVHSSRTYFKDDISGVALRLASVIENSGFVKKQLDEIPVNYGPVNIGVDVEDIISIVLLSEAVCPGKLPAYVTKLRNDTYQLLCRKISEVAQTPGLITDQVSMIKNLESKLAKLS
ncbi:hypothetical protein OBP_029 [Pseudomonas phage OBP]|uniref:hypothetical protein n=1 Tax=Pseudomonas phage OBP TaxID=1124849 RepID=UPI000240D61A|nr:hypothetical protein OBP_029 [Pseudomonas phage OBP]AEV89466.1 hypothetical protein OBP_029 [Pseudomonas phage OBP]